MLVLGKLVRLGKVAIYIEVVGSVPQEFVSTILSILEEAYTLFDEVSDLVEVYIYEDSNRLLQSLYRAAIELGVTAIGAYPVSHDAWFGWPRIHIDYSMCRGLDMEVLKALLVHEATHTVLHGNIQSYTVALARVPQEFRKPEIIYLASVAVKDAEVFTYLARKSLIRYIEAYQRFVESEIRGVRCRSIEEILELAKLLTPCTAIKCNENVVSEGCKEIGREVIDALRKAVSEGRELSERIVILLQQLSKVMPINNFLNAEIR